MLALEYAALKLACLIFKKIAPSYLCNGEARHFKFGVHVDIEGYYRMHNRLHPSGSMYSGFSDFFNFWEITLLTISHMTETVRLVPYKIRTQLQRKH